MTSQAVLKSLRSTRVKRMTLNGRSERFLDTIAFYHCSNPDHFNLFGRKINRNCSQHNSNNNSGINGGGGKGSLRLIPEKLGRRYVQKEFTFSCSKSMIENEKEFNIDFRVDGKPLPGHKHLLKEVAISLQEDAFKLLRNIVKEKYEKTEFLEMKEVIELSVVLCDDDHIQSLNKEWRGVNKPTDVLSFALVDNEDDKMPVCLLGDIVISLETALRQANERELGLLSECRILLLHGFLHLLGYDHDASDEDWEKMSKMEKEIMEELGWKGEGLIRLAERDSYESSDSNSEDLDMNNGFHIVNQQKQKERHNNNSETTINQTSDTDFKDKSIHKNKKLTDTDTDTDIDNTKSSPSSNSSSSELTSHSNSSNNSSNQEIYETNENTQLILHKNITFNKTIISNHQNNTQNDSLSMESNIKNSEKDIFKLNIEDTNEIEEKMEIKLEIPEIKLITIDMDGTLLDSENKIGDKTRDAILAARAKDVEVVLATGKARPGAISACKKFGLYGDRGLISTNYAGIFLQGLVVYNFKGQMMGGGPTLPPDIVKKIFEYSNKNEIACTAFFGDTCGTLKMMPKVMELHKKYYEPMSIVYDSIEALLSHSSIKKIILLDNEKTIENEIQPHWNNLLKNTNITTTMAVPTMLEILPRGIDKWGGIKRMIKGTDIKEHNIMAIGDGTNDIPMIEGSGLGIAMGNAADEVKGIADIVVDTNDRDGLADAINTFVLNF